MRNIDRENKSEFEINLVDERTVIPRGNGKGSIRVTLYGPVVHKIYTRKTYSDGRVEFIPVEINEKPDDESSIDNLVSVGISNKDAKKNRRK